VLDIQMMVASRLDQIAATVNIISGSATVSEAYQYLCFIAGSDMQQVPFCCIPWIASITLVSARSGLKLRTAPMTTASSDRSFRIVWQLWA
jgi:precorrin-6B methylase 1